MQAQYRYNTGLMFLALLAFAVMVSLLTGCGFQFSKNKASRATDSLHVKKVNSGSVDSAASGSVKTNAVKSKDDYEWWRVIMQQPRDTTIVHNSYYPQPATIIYEGGKGVKEESQTSTDSSWKLELNRQYMNAIDSLKTELREASKQKEGKVGLTLPMLLIVGAAFIALNFLINHLKSNYSFTKKTK